MTLSHIDSHFLHVIDQQDVAAGDGAVGLQKGLFLIKCRQQGLLQVEGQPSSFDLLFLATDGRIHVGIGRKTLGRNQPQAFGQSDLGVGHIHIRWQA